MGGHIYPQPLLLLKWVGHTIILVRETWRECGEPGFIYMMLLNIMAVRGNGYDDVGYRNPRVLTHVRKYC